MIFDYWIKFRKILLNMHKSVLRWWFCNLKATVKLLRKCQYFWHATKLHNWKHFFELFVCFKLNSEDKNNASKLGFNIKILWSLSTQNYNFGTSCTLSCVSTSYVFYPTKIFHRMLQHQSVKMSLTAGTTLISLFDDGAYELT